MKDGFVKVAALTPPCKVADTAFNADAIAALAAEYAAKGCKLIVFPEMAVTGYTVADLLTQDALLDASDAALLSIAKKTAKSDCAVVVGAPVRADGKLYDCAAVLNGGRVVGVVPKTAIPNYGEFYEGRYFASAKDAVAKEARVGAQVVPFGADLLFRCKGMPEFCFGVEICEDMWGAKSPSSELCAAGATIVCNPSASDEIVGKAEYRRLLVRAACARRRARGCAVMSMRTPASARARRTRCLQATTSLPRTRRCSTRARLSAKVRRLRSSTCSNWQERGERAIPSARRSECERSNLSANSPRDRARSQAVAYAVRARRRQGQRGAV